MATTRSPAAKTCAGICEQLSNLLRYEQQNKKQEGAKGASAEPRVKNCAGVPQPSAHQRWQLGAGGPECVFWSESRGAGRTSSSRVTDPACFNKIARSGQAEDPGTTRTTRSALTLPKLTQWAGCCSACTRRNRLREMCVVRAPAGCRGPGRLTLCITGAQPHHLPSVPSEPNRTAPGKGCPEPATWVTDCARPKHPRQPLHTQPVSHTQHRMLHALRQPLPRQTAENLLFSHCAQSSPLRPPCWAGRGCSSPSPRASLPSLGTCCPQARPLPSSTFEFAPHSVLPVSLPSAHQLRQRLSYWRQVRHQSPLAAAPFLLVFCSGLSFRTGEGHRDQHPGCPLNLL